MIDKLIGKIIAVQDLPIHYMKGICFRGKKYIYIFTSNIWESLVPMFHSQICLAKKLPKVETKL